MSAIPAASTSITAWRRWRSRRYARPKADPTMTASRIQRAVALPSGAKAKLTKATAAMVPAIAAHSVHAAEFARTAAKAANAADTAATHVSAPSEGANGSPSIGAYDV